MEKTLKETESCLKPEDINDMSLRNQAICAIMGMDMEDVEKYLLYIKDGKI